MAKKRSYQHSRVFDEYKQTQEVIKGNLTSWQYLQTLDYFLWHSVEPIFTECPSLFNNYVAKIAARQVRKTSTKFTSEDRHKLPVLLFNMLTAETPRKAFEHAKAMRLNRGLIFGFTAFFCKALSDYERLNDPLYDIDRLERQMLLARIEQSVGLRHNGSLYSALQQVKHWDDKARAFKAMIVQKYTRMAILNAKNTYEDFNHSVRLDDAVQEYMITVNRAIDRCDANQGVLTTFIQSWFKSAKSEVANMSKGQNDESYDALAEEHGDAVSDILGFSVPDEEPELHQHVAFVAKRFDPQGWLRASLHIPEFLTQSEKQILLLFTDPNDSHNATA